MQEKEAKNFNKYLLWAGILALIVLSFFVIRPFIIPLISAFVLAYLVKPIYNYLKPKLGKTLSSLTCILLIIIIVILPLGAVIGNITSQATSILNENDLGSLLENIPFIDKFDINLTTLTERGIEILVSLFTSAASHLPGIAITLLITLLGIHYILIDWDLLSKNLRRYMPFKDKERVSKEISQITNTIVYGTILIAFIEFVIAALGFFISGVGPFILLPILIAFFAFIPGLGPTIVWVPLALYYLLTQNYFAAIGVIITGLILSFVIDTILRAKVLGRKAKINPLLMLIGILGGISLFGIFGFIIGPIVLIYTLELLEEIVKNQ